MHGGAITTTTSASKFSNSTIVNSASLHQSNHDDGTITVSILHPHQVHMDDFIASTTNLHNAPCSTTSNQIVPSQTKIIVSSNEFQALKEDVSSVLFNGNISNTNDPNVLILPETETCDKDTLSLSQLTSSHQADQVEIDLQDINSVNDETSSGEGELSAVFILLFSQPKSSVDVADADLSCFRQRNERKEGKNEIIIARSEQTKAKGNKAKKSLPKNAMQETIARKEKSDETNNNKTNALYSKYYPIKVLLLTKISPK